MAFNAAALRAVELSSYSALELVDLLVCNRDRAADINAVARVLSARESRFYKLEAQLKADLADATSKVQALEEDLRRASLPEAEGSARLGRIAQEEARALLRAAVSEIHEAGKRKQDEVSAHLDAALDEIRALHRRQQQDLSARVATIVDETEAKLKASFAKIHDAPLKKPERDVVPGQGMMAPDVDGTAIPVLASPSVEVGAARKSKRPVVETVMVTKGLGDRAAADGSVGKSLKRKVSGGSPSVGSGRGTSNTSVNRPVMGTYSLKRPSPVVAAGRPRTVQKCSARTETASQSRNENEGQAKTNTASSGHAIPGTQGLPPPSSNPLGIKNVSAAEIRCILGTGSKGTGAAEETSDEEGDVGTSGKDTGGASARA